MELSGASGPIRHLGQEQGVDPAYGVHPSHLSEAPPASTHPVEPPPATLASSPLVPSRQVGETASVLPLFLKAKETGVGAPCSYMDSWINNY